MEGKKLREVEADALAVGVAEDGKLQGWAKKADKKAQGRILGAEQSGDLGKQPGQAVILEGFGKAKRILAVRMPKEGAGPKAHAQAWAKGLEFAARNSAARSVAVLLDGEPVCGRGAPEALRALVLEAQATAYRFEGYKSKAGADAALESVEWLAGGEDHEGLSEDFEFALGVARAVDFAKDLANAPANEMTPKMLAKAALEGAEELGLQAAALDRKQIEKLGMKSFLAVAQGSAQEPRLIELAWRGAGEESAPVVLVGKGITFDSGGVSLKPGEGMDEMKFDMCGAAAAIAAVREAARLKMKVNVVAVVPACENMPDGHAVKPGDVVRSMDGQTIEILNTDAEGRLILCDALCYARKFEPAAVVDIATLTGACAVALGQHAAGLFSGDDALADLLDAAGRGALDRAWRMPMWDEYQEQLKSAVADMGNIGGKYGGSITAACFLSRFAKGMRWAHLDIAGVAWKDKKATGRPVPLLMEFLRRAQDGELG